MGRRFVVPFFLTVSGFCKCRIRCSHPCLEQAMVLRNGGHFPRHGFSPGSMAKLVTHTHVSYVLSTWNSKQPYFNGCFGETTNKEWLFRVPGLCENTCIYYIQRRNNLLECFCMNTIKLAFAFAAWKKQERFCQKKVQHSNVHCEQLVALCRRQ